MAFAKEDLLRLPVLALFDAFLASRIPWVWNYGSFFGYLLTLLGAVLSLSVFSCQHGIILDLYCLLVASAIQCAVHVWNFTVIQISHQDYYEKGNSTKSIIVSVVERIWTHDNLSLEEIDFSTKALMSITALQVMHFFTLVLLKENVSVLRMLLVMSPALSLAFNIPRVLLLSLILASNLPILSLFGQKVKNIRNRLSLVSQLRRDQSALYSLDSIIGWVNTTWVKCRVPSVLRLYFIFKCALGLIVLSSNHGALHQDSYGSVKKSGLYYFFHPNTNEYTEWNTMEPHFYNETKQRNLTVCEGLAVFLTDSLISSFAVGSAISVAGFYAGVGIHNFVGGNDIMQGEALGMMSSVLFCLLAIQTGLSGLPPLRRLGRLYRNSFLLASAVLHFFLDVVQPVLMTISPQSHIPMKKHLRPLLVCLVLFILPSWLCYWLVTTKPISTWMVALTSFNFELIVKVVSTLIVYALYVADGRSHTAGIVNLDEYVFWIRSTSHVIEFICGLIMFANGAYILIFESSNLLRAVMMVMHAYVNIYRTLREGLKTLNNRRTVNKRIASLQLVNFADIEDCDRDVCSICYQEFTVENGEIRITRCRHMFHSPCLRKWIFIQDSCPMCDRSLFPVTEEQDKTD